MRVKESDRKEVIKHLKMMKQELGKAMRNFNFGSACDDTVKNQLTRIEANISKAKEYWKK